MRPVLFLLALASAGLSAACEPYGYAGLVRRDLQGGTLTLRGDPRAAMNDARLQMQDHCRGPFTVVLEEMATVGQTTHSSGSATRGRRWSSSSSSTTTTGVQEHRLTYVCGASAGAVAAAPSPAAPSPAAPASAAAPEGSAGPPAP